MAALYTYSDGGARGNPGPAAIGVVLCDERSRVVYEGARRIGRATNNQAEYQAMIWALELARERRAEELLCHADSELLVFQIQGRYRIKNIQLKPLAEKVKSLAAGFKSIRFRQIPRESAMIARADQLLNRALDRDPAPEAPASGAGDLRQDEFF